MSPTHPKVSLTDLVSAFEFASMAGVGSTQAFISVKTGKTYIVSDEWGSDDDVPDDLETIDDYLVLPDKKELGLGRDLVFAFV